MSGLALSFAVVLLPLTGYLAGGLAHTYWGYEERGLIVWPIVLFALSCACLAVCAFTRQIALFIFLVLVAVGIVPVLVVLAAATFAY